LKRLDQGTALTTGTLALPALVIEGLEEFKGSFDRLCLQAGIAAIEAMLAADAEQLCGKRYQRHADRQGHRWGMVDSEVGWHGGKAATAASLLIGSSLKGVAVSRLMYRPRRTAHSWFCSSNSARQSRVMESTPFLEEVPAGRNPSLQVKVGVVAGALTALELGGFDVSHPVC